MLKIPQSFSSRKASFILAGIYLLVIALIVLIWLQPLISPEILLRDVFTLADVPPYYGLLSNCGVFLWCITASVNLFSAVILSYAKREREFSLLLLFFGLISLILMLDDGLLLHESVVPKILENILSYDTAETLLPLAYGSAMIYSLLRFHKTIRNTDYKFLFLALLFLFSSLVVDHLIPLPDGRKYWLRDGENFLIEDGLKLLGIVTWAFYFIQTSFSRIVSLTGHMKADSLK
ncbi:hypothetical protein N836_03965 [Leptolyngbya sp. Heron Island J]|uniref:hypothetical protein n=1 Tax=Leptolyngbya sp. Heron Island J TaxID=1385935 RepID=UPI0003B9A55B|nr:hypothetical protein [Leptolyngbya sp. Heron Island J]ESA37264.1 hypothetical protein N836_03965 [Leptolyngbya sp. Heron Island J]